MSKLRNFVEGAAQVASVQESILNAMEATFSQEAYAQLEAAILAPGLEGWEGRALSLVKTAVHDNFSALQAQVEGIKARYKNVVPYPGQDQEYWVDEKKKPHLRVYWCLRCGYKMTSLALSGICCHGQPECSRCHHAVHEKNCRRKSVKQPERKS